MPNKYKYIDPEYIYTDPETGVLRNKDIYERYMSGTIDGDVEKLTTLIAELITG